MPPSRTRKGKKAKAAEPVKEPTPEQPAVADDESMETDQPGPSNSVVGSAKQAVKSTEQAVEHAVEVAVEKVADVMEAAGEFVEDMTMKGVEDSGPSRSNSSDDTTPSESKEGSEGATKMTLEERKAKLNELRKKMVRLDDLLQFQRTNLRFCSFFRLLHREPTGRR